MNYYEYIESAEWNEKRAEYGRSSLPQHCLTCGEMNYTLHQRNYARLGAELLTDLIPLCWPCHKRLHASKEKCTGAMSFVARALAKVFGLDIEDVKRRLKPWTAPVSVAPKKRLNRKEKRTAKKRRRKLSQMSKDRALHDRMCRRR